MLFPTDFSSLTFTRSLFTMEYLTRGIYLTGMAQGIPNGTFIKSFIYCLRPTYTGFNANTFRVRCLLVLEVSASSLLVIEDLGIKTINAYGNDSCIIRFNYNKVFNFPYSEYPGKIGIIFVSSRLDENGVLTSDSLDYYTSSTTSSSRAFATTTLASTIFDSTVGASFVKSDVTSVTFIFAESGDPDVLTPNQVGEGCFDIESGEGYQISLPNKDIVEFSFIPTVNENTTLTILDEDSFFGHINFDAETQTNTYELYNPETNTYYSTDLQTFIAYMRNATPPIFFQGQNGQLCIITIHTEPQPPIAPSCPGFWNKKNAAIGGALIAFTALIIFGYRKNKRKK